MSIYRTLSLWRRRNARARAAKVGMCALCLLPFGVLVVQVAGPVGAVGVPIWVAVLVAVAVRAHPTIPQLIDAVDGEDQLLKTAFEVETRGAVGSDVMQQLVIEAGETRIRQVAAPVRPVRTPWGHLGLGLLALGVLGMWAPPLADLASDGLSARVPTGADAVDQRRLSGNAPGLDAARQSTALGAVAETVVGRGRSKALSSELVMALDRVLGGGLGAGDQPTAEGLASVGEQPSTQVGSSAKAVRSQALALFTREFFGEADDARSSGGAGGLRQPGMGGAEDQQSAEGEPTPWAEERKDMVELNPGAIRANNPSKRTGSAPPTELSDNAPPPERGDPKEGRPAKSGPNGKATTDAQRPGQFGNNEASGSDSHRALRDAPPADLAQQWIESQRHDAMAGTLRRLEDGNTGRRSGVGYRDLLLNYRAVAESAVEDDVLDSRRAYVRAYFDLLAEEPGHDDHPTE